MAPQVGLVLIPFGVKAVRFGEEFPVNVLGTLPGIINLMLGKFGRKPMERAFVDAADETLNNLMGQKLQILEKLRFVKFRSDIHRCWKYKTKKAWHLPNLF
jgi:hypothetical protein